MKYKLIIFIILLFIASNLVCAGWWNESYAYRRLINCSGVSNGVPVVINGSNGFRINGSVQVVWTRCTSGDLSVYYNDYSDYVVANDTGKQPFQVELGNGTSHNPTLVWDDYDGVWHMNNLLDSSGNNRHLTAHGNPSLVDAKIGKGYSLDGDDYFTAGNSYALTDLTVMAWVVFGNPGVEEHVGPAPDNRWYMFKRSNNS